jgi:hypothetical protein
LSTLGAEYPIPNVAGAIAQLHKVPGFLDLTLHRGIDERTNEYGEPWEYVSEHHIFHWPDMSSFKDLRTLDLQGLHGDIPNIVLDIANVIIASPNLKAFGLSMHRNSWRAREREEDDLLMVVKEIERQKPPNGTSPLALETMILGLGTLPQTLYRGPKILKDYKDSLIFPR